MVSRMGKKVGVFILVFCWTLVSSGWFMIVMS